MVKYTNAPTYVNNNQNPVAERKGEEVILGHV